METAVTRIKTSQTGAEGPQLLTAPELARALRLNPQTLYRLARRGLIPSIRIGKKLLRFDPIQVRSALEARQDSQPRISPVPPPTGRLSFKRLEDLLAQNRWIEPPPDLTLDRFAPRFPRSADLTSLAYERKRP